MFISQLLMILKKSAGMSVSVSHCVNAFRVGCVMLRYVLSFIVKLVALTTPYIGIILFPLMISAL